LYAGKRPFDFSLLAKVLSDFVIRAVEMSMKKTFPTAVVETE